MNAAFRLSPLEPSETDLSREILCALGAEQRAFVERSRRPSL